MRKLIFIAVSLTIFAMILVSCQTNSFQNDFGGGVGDHHEGVYDPAAKEVVESFVKDLTQIREENEDVELGTCDDPNNPIHNAIESLLGSYFFTDDSLVSYPSGGSEGALSNIATVYCYSIDELITTQVISYGKTVLPEDYGIIPKELQDEDIRALATIDYETFSSDGTLTRYVLKIGDKWYIRALYYKEGDTDFSAYPDGDLFW
jgi:hypothetical protein